MDSKARIRLKLFGGFHAAHADGREISLTARKGEALAAYLALNQSQRQTRERLAALLWSDRFEEQARRSLRQTILLLRRALDDDKASILVSEGERLKLNSEAVAVDVLAFEQLAAESSRESLEKAVTIYGDELLAGLNVKSEGFVEWLANERARLRDLMINASERLASYQAEAGETDIAIQTAQRLLTLDPLHEEAHRMLMRLYVNVGRRSAALKQYRVCQEILRRELNADPDPETTRLNSEIRTRQVERDKLDDAKVIQSGEGVSGATADILTGRVRVTSKPSDPSSATHRNPAEPEPSHSAREGVERRLAAIMSADVVGYSRLMGRDEAGTLGRLRALRTELMEPRIAAHEGRIVKLMGDGALVEFSSAVDAVQCALEIQQAIAERNTQEPAERRMLLRVGVNTGEVIVEDADIYGDAVNVAARLQEVCKPGGVCVSGEVRRLVRGKVSVAFEDTGEQTLKNITEPVGVFHALPGAPSATWAGEVDVSKPVAGFGGRPAIAVLPFENMGRDPEQEYFADGIAEDLITNLSLWRWFPVIARNSTFTYKGKQVDAVQIGAELGARYVLEGSVRKAGKRVRITAQLIDATSNAHLWAERYDRDLDDIFTIQDEITERVVACITPEILAAEEQRVFRKPPADLGAWDLIARGKWHLNRLTKEDMDQARALCAQAMQLDPNWSWPHAWTAFTHLFNLVLGWVPDSVQALSALVAAANTAVELDEKEPLGHIPLSYGLAMLRQPERAVTEAARAVELGPSLSLAHLTLGYALTYAGRLPEAIDELGTALRLDPRDMLFSTFTLSHAALSHLLMKDFDAAIASARKALQLNSKNIRAHHRLACALGHKGDLDGARAAFAESKKLLAGPTIEYFDATYPFTNAEDREVFVDGLRKAGWEG